MGDVQRKVSLVFDADISKAKSAMNDLYGTLNKISSMQLGRVEGQMLSKDINEAAIAAAHLKVNLESAVNVDTGKLDLKKFNSNLQKSKMSLQDYQRILVSCGPAGKQAFTQLAQSIITADTKVIHLSDKLKDLGVTLANTAKWQLSSNIMHGIESVLSNAYSYAKDLNKSLNDIRIVTSKSVGEMKTFAAEANKAAQALSTTTTEYSDASLIFFQQGLKDDDVKQRTEAVIKLASVTGETASQVSDYMTAIWNNFSDGTIPLEHYADVLTKLGAATASSSEEIAGGLEKFSAVAKTIGLSYEYAASALATITAQTRQSEDVVGTALKTIFARIQGLQLGETLEDGVTLNKYSEALKTVGVSIFESNGELRKMDNILDELGSKWGTLSKAEQTALAQTVAGVRQYNQLMALMDNWSDFEVNVDMSVNADGSLDEQYEIYTQSWEAASKRMKAAMEDIYDSLINDEAMIALTDFFTDFIQSISASIDSIGGLSGVLTILGSILLKVFSPQITSFIDSTILKFQNFKSIITGTQSSLEKQKQDAATMLGNQYRESGTSAGILQGQAADQMSSLSQTYLLNIEKLAPYEKQVAESMYQRAQALNEAVIAQGELTAEAEKEYKTRLNYMRASTTIRDIGATQDKQTKQYTFDRSKQWVETKTTTDTEGKQVQTQEMSERGQTQYNALKKYAKNAQFDQTTGKLTMGDEAAVLTAQKAAMEAYSQSLEKATMLKHSFMEPSTHLQEHISEFQALNGEITTIGQNFSEASVRTEQFTQLNEKINSSKFKEFHSGIEASISQVEALEASFKKQGKALEDAFGDKKTGKLVVAYKKKLIDVKVAQEAMGKSADKVSELEKKVASTKDVEKKKTLTDKLNQAYKELAEATDQYGKAERALRGGEEFKQIAADINALDQETREAREALIALGYTDAQLEKIEAACEQAGISFTDLVTNIQKAKQASENASDTMDKFSQSSMTAGKVMSGIGTIASQLAMSFNAIKGFGDIWSNEDLAIGEKVTSTLMNLSMLIPAISAAMVPLTLAVKSFTINLKLKHGVITQEMADQERKMAMDAAETAGLWGKAAAWIAAHPLIAGIGIAAVATAITVLALMTNQHKKDTEALEKKAEAAKKVAEASEKTADKAKEEMNSVADLANQYDELYERYLKGEVTKSEFIDTTSDLVEELKIEDGQLLILQKDYDTLNAKIKDRLKLTAQENASKAKIAADDAIVNAQAQLKTNTDTKLVWDSNKIGFEGLSESTDKWFFDYFDKNKDKMAPGWSRNGGNITASYTNQNQLTNLRAQFDAIFTAALQSVGGGSALTENQRSGIYKSYQFDIVNSGNEVASNAWQSIDKINTAQQADFESFLYNKNVNNADDYNTAREEWINAQIQQTGVEREYWENLIDQMAFSSTDFTTYARQNAAVQSQQNRLPAAAGWTYEQLVQQYGEDVVLKADIYPEMDSEQLQRALAIAQKEIDDNNLQVKITAATEGAEELKKVTNIEEYKQWWEKYGASALNGTTYDMNSFASLSPSQQQAILKEQTKTTPQANIPSFTYGSSGGGSQNGETEGDTTEDKIRTDKAAEAETDLYIVAAQDKAKAKQEAWFNYYSSKDKSDYYNELGEKTIVFQEKDKYGQIVNQEGIQKVTGNEAQGVNTVDLSKVTNIGHILSKSGQKVTAENYKKLIDTWRNNPQNLTKAISEGGLGLTDSEVASLNIFMQDRYNGAAVTDTAIDYDMNLLFGPEGALQWYNDRRADAKAIGMGKDAWNNDAYTEASGKIKTIYAEGDQLLQESIAAQNEVNKVLEERNRSTEEAEFEKAFQFKQELTNLGLDIDSVYELADAIQESAHNSEIFSDNLQTDDNAVKEVAKQMSRYNKAVAVAADKTDEWITILSSDNLAEKTELLNELKTVYADMFDIDASTLSKDFLLDPNNILLMKEAMAGSEEAYNSLQAAITKNTFSNTIGEISSEMDKLIDEISSKKILVGELIQGESELGEQLNTAYQYAYEAAIKGGKKVSEAIAIANEIMAQQGYETPEIEWEKQPITGTTPPGWVPMPDGSVAGPDNQPIEGIKWEATPGNPYTYFIMAPKIKTVTKSAENLGGTTIKPKSSGGSSKKTSESRQKKSDTVERYKEVNDKIDDITREMKKSSSAADRLWGPARVEQMEKVNDALKEEIELIKDKRKESEYYLQEDKNALNTAAADLGLTFAYDEQGNISNYEDQMTALYNAREALLDSFGSEINKSEQTKLDDIDKRISTLKEAINQYDKTKELQQDLTTEIQNKINEWQDQNYKLLNMKLELTIKLNDSQMEVLNYWLTKIENDIYKTVEAFKLLSEQTDLYTSNLEAQSQYFEDLNSDYENGKISLADYKNGLQSTQKTVISNLQSLEKQKTTMQEYYGGVMDMALKKIAMYSDEMSNLTRVLDHYNSILELTGKQNDYLTKNTILKNKANVLKSELQIQKNQYDASVAEAQQWFDKMNSAIEGSNEFETYQKNWQAAQAAANDAQDKMLSKTEEWAKAMKTIIENELAEIAETFEKSLTGGISFDELMASMKRRSSLQEEYLTTTNKIYETNKLMRTVQQEIDKTTNTVAKKRLQGFINETNQLQNQTKLSQYELNIQKAKYNLLLAEIALEEAQNAKSTVRLQRDAEGNFGYVYTANANKVADAESKLADAQNNLYNIALKGANDYQQKYAETLQESQDAITELTTMWMNGKIASEEEFNRRKMEITEYYGEKLQQYSELHNIALQTDSRVLTEAWSSDFIERTASVETWKNNVKTYFDEAGMQMAAWAEVTKQVLDQSGLSDMDKALGEVNAKHQALLNILLGEDGKSGLIHAMEEQVIKAGEVSEAHIAMQNEISKTTEEYEKLLTAINNANIAMTEVNKPAISTEGGEYIPPNDKQAKIPGASPSTTSSDGDNKSLVKAVQKVLGVDADGIWGPKSKAAALKQYQTENYEEIAKKLKQQNHNDFINLTGFDTGGYTGSWGSYGKMALLHEKELILNAHDTENFLASMEVLERILSIIDLQSLNARLNSSLMSPGIMNTRTSETVEQNVHIEASFPGVTNHTEIEEAFTNLVNQASQYANRK